MSRESLIFTEWAIYSCCNFFWALSYVNVIKAGILSGRTSTWLRGLWGEKTAGTFKAILNAPLSSCFSKHAPLAAKRTKLPSAHHDRPPRSPTFTQSWCWLFWLQINCPFAEFRKITWNWTWCMYLNSDRSMAFIYAPFFTVFHSKAVSDRDNLESLTLNPISEYSKYFIPSLKSCVP